MRIAFATLPGVAQQQQSGGAMRRPMRGSNRPQRGRGGNRRRENRPKPSEEELDAEMDSYMAGPVSRQLNDWCFIQIYWHIDIQLIEWWSVNAKCLVQETIFV